MIINSLGLKHFGKFQDEKIELQNGINLLYGTNEAGKSTIHTFIKGMLFGIDKQRGRKSFDVYTRYKPWDTPTLYDGELEITVEEVPYLIKRNLYKEEKSVQIINIDTGREVPYKEQRGGCFIEGLTESNYSNTVFVAQQQVATNKELAFRINDYITNMSTTKSSEINVNQAIKELQARKKEIELRQTKQQIKELNIELHQIQTTDFMLKELERQIVGFDKEIQTLNLEKENSKIEGGYLQKLQILDSYIKEYDIIVEKYQSLRDCRDYYYQVMQHIKAWDSVKVKQDNPLPMENSPPNQMDPRHKPKSYKGYLLSVCLLVISFLICILVPLKGLDKGFIMVATAILSISILLVQLIVNNKKKIPIEERLAEQPLTDQEKLHVNQSIEEYHEISKRLLTRMQAQEEDILMYANKVVAMNEVNSETMKVMHQEIDKLASQLNKQKDVIQQKQAREKEVIRLIETASAKKEKLRWEFSRLEESIADYAKKRALRDELMERRKKEDVEVTAIDISIQTIQDLAAAIHDDFGEKLNRSISEISTAFTLGNCYDVKVDEKLNMKIVKGSDFVPMEYLSTGTVEQLYLALRLVAADLLLKDKEMPLILDDAFVYYDDDRLEETICELAARTSRQILIFTCHNRERQALDKHQIPYNYIEL
ncbi:AAA domain-containing protein [Anaerosporobacter mobilis DSM 15930]|uniref:AAA domain-containing protein n=1 Tax=Anaerosporobacter mobilis DSM 15930 TaxID=1120996 RepID=A0A1M7HW21_9FIRM|nr:AAA family ATPase [Anaerosporobacter mobilis]SHM32684.1 AAA domain-containing protein [Anaerosporobacter mobilis DSM 15930]